jgi:hypothetical protein
MTEDEKLVQAYWDHVPDFKTFCEKKRREAELTLSGVTTFGNRVVLLDKVRD